MLSVRFEDNGSGHNDIVLRFGGEQWVCDSYYLALDSGLLPEREDAGKIRVVLLRLLEQWQAAVARLPDGGTVYLPYDFSDQCTCWLACKRTGGEVIVSRGWADLEGWSFSPSNAGNLFNCPRGFRIDGPTVRSQAAEFVEAVRNSLAQVANSNSPLGRAGQS
jgi:hypothetical protein